MYGGKIVCTASLGPFWIEQARASERLYIDYNNIGYVWEPDITRIPQTPKEVMEFEKWYPLESLAPSLNILKQLKP